jgi:hypothetical protein
MKAKGDDHLVGEPFLIKEGDEGEIAVVEVPTSMDEGIVYQVWAGDRNFRASFELNLYGRVTWPKRLKGRYCSVAVNDLGGPDMKPGAATVIGHVKVEEEKSGEVRVKVEVPPRCATGLVILRQTAKPGSRLRLRFALRNERRFVNWGAEVRPVDNRTITAEITRLFAWSESPSEDGWEDFEEEGEEEP